MKFFINFLKGIFLGMGAILPGISSGVLCVIFGIYEKLINSILGIFKDLKNNIKFLLPICSGGLVGVLLFGKGLNYLFSTYPMQSNFAFIGLIVGTIPALIKEANKKGFNLHYLIYLIFGTFLTLILLQYESNFTLINNNLNYSYFYLILCGFFMSIGVVVPGVSSTVILMLLGVYSIYLESISNMNLYILAPIGIGLLFGSILWLKIIKLLLVKLYSPTFYCIIGFVIGSLFILYPGFSFNITGVISIFLFFICLFISYMMEKLNNILQKKN